MVEQQFFLYKGDIDSKKHHSCMCVCVHVCVRVCICFDAFVWVNEGVCTACELIDGCLHSISHPLIYA